MKYSEFQRWLISQGCTIQEARGKGSHRLVQYGDRQTVFPYHGSKEMNERTRLRIIKQLGL